MKQISLIPLSVLLLGMFIAGSDAHPGRRFEVVVVNGQLAVHGYISTGPSDDDDGGNPRPYFNALHDHWLNFPGAVEAATAELPSFDVYSPNDSFVGAGSAETLQGADLTLTLQNAFKWTSPATSGPVLLEQLDAAVDPVITIERTIGAVTESISTESGGALTLASNIASTGADDLDLEYSIAAEPSGIIHALEWVLSTSKPGIADSEKIYTFLSPDRDPDGPGGNDPSALVGLHHPSLYVESQFGIPIPEPYTLALLGFGLASLVLARRGNGRP